MFAYCAKPEPAQQEKTQCTSLFFAENHPNGVFFWLHRTWPDTIIIQEHQLHIFFGDITDMVFLLIVPDLTWYNKQKHDYSM